MCVCCVGLRVLYAYRMLTCEGCVRVCVCISVPVSVCV